MTHAAQPGGVQFRQSNKKSNTLRNVLLVVGGLFVVLMLLGVLAGVGIFKAIDGATEEPVAVSKQMIDAMQRNDTDAAYALTNDAFKSTSTRNDLERLTRQVAASEPTGTKVTGRSVKNTNGLKTASVTMEIKTASGQTLRPVTELSEVNGTWAVSSLRLRS